MTSSRIGVVVLLGAILMAPAVAASDPQFHYLDPRKIDLTVLLPPPPDLGSVAQRTDQQQVAEAIGARNVAQLTEAREASRRSVFFFATSIGPGFTPARLPLTSWFFGRVASDVQKLVDLAKSYWERPRPNGAIKRRGSYPSGHAAFAASSAILLGQLLPSRRDAVFAQARTFAENRIVLGLHYPSDIAAGWTAGTLAAFVMMQDPGFRHDFAAVKAELQHANLSSATYTK